MLGYENWLSGTGPKRFRLCLRCDKCGVETHRILSVPVAPNAPNTASQLGGSAVLQREPFTCKRCSWEFALLTHATLLSAAEAA